MSSSERLRRALYRLYRACFRGREDVSLKMHCP